MKVVLVTWLDATRGDDSPALEDVGSATRRTVGWLARKDERGVLIAMSRDSGVGIEPFDKWFFVPALYIKSMKVLANES